MLVLNELLTIKKCHVDEYIMNAIEKHNCSFFLNIYEEIHFLNIDRLHPSTVEVIRLINTIFHTIVVHYNFSNIDGRFKSVVQSQLESETFGTIELVQNELPSELNDHSDDMYNHWNDRYGDSLVGNEEDSVSTPATTHSHRDDRDTTTSYTNMRQEWFHDLLDSNKIKYVVTSLLKFINDPTTLETIQSILFIYQNEETINMTHRKSDIYSNLFRNTTFLQKISKTTQWEQYNDNSYMGQYINCLGDLEIVERFDIHDDTGGIMMRWFEHALQYNLDKMKLNYIHSTKYASSQLLITIARIFIKYVNEKTVN